MIPAIADPLGYYWEQPDPSEIELDDTHALMTRAAFEKLQDYSMSVPTGVYAGKMWKAEMFLPVAGRLQSIWYLVWYSDDKDGYCTINRREILVVA